LYERHQDAIKAEVRSFDLNNVKFDFQQNRYLMGVINLSTQSWYRESVSLSADSAIERGYLLKAQGAHIVDIGAESTLDHALRIGAGDQQSALIPVVQALAQHVPVSIETYHPEVTQQGLKAGAALLNLTGTTQIEEHLRIVAEHDAGVIICFVQGANVREVQDLTLETDMVGVMYEYFARRIEMAEKCGVHKIFIDPGLGFYYRNLQDSAKRVQYQMETFLNTFRLRKLGWPTCHALPHAFDYFKEEVRCAESFMAVLALLGKTDLLRTHEVPKVRAVLETMGVFKN